MAKLLVRIGFVWKRPKCVPAKADADAQQAFLAQTLALLMATAEVDPARLDNPNMLLALASSGHLIWRSGRSAHRSHYLDDSGRSHQRATHFLPSFSPCAFSWASIRGAS
ncbi:HTH_33 domain-containing protein (plasmid) [Rhodovastum atsumiense]|uniref:Winged helix-turn helix domain-containing protein n=2 Tax=Rhodovastum atsumiense TaxID=504468 RepID=A0A5M6IJZ2_9PROT|nr:hypothetical protein F1189_31170 [Rhodovastum atsumiense]CAH2605851.1 HTH_33 domain-containing protein [Rhodovastum atsumiense]